MQEDVIFKVKVESGGFKATQMALEKQPIRADSPMGISPERLKRFKKAFEAKWLKKQLDKTQNQKPED